MGEEEKSVGGILLAESRKSRANCVLISLRHTHTLSLSLTHTHTLTLTACRVTVIQECVCGFK